MQQSILKYEAAVQKILDGNSMIRSISKISSELSIPIYLGGGTLRDILLGTGKGSDFDLYFQCAEKPFLELQDAIRKDAELTKAFHAGAFDVRRAHNVPKYVQQFDFTINTLSYDLQTKKLCATSRALEDIQARRLRVNCVPFFAANPHAFLRGFRIAQRCNLQVEDGFTDTVRRFGPMFGCLDAVSRSECVAELLYLLSAPSIDPQWNALESSRVLIQLFPFLLGVEELEQQRADLGISSNYRAMRAVETTVEKLPAAVRENASVIHRKDYLHEKKRLTSHFSELAVVRLSLLFANIGAAWVSLDKLPDSQFNTPERAAHTAKTFLIETTSSLELNPPLHQAFAIACEVSLRAQHLRALQWSQTLSAIKATMDTSLQRLLAIHFLALLASGNKVSQNNPDRKEAEKALLGALC